MPPAMGPDDTGYFRLHRLLPRRPPRPVRRRRRTPGGKPPHLSDRASRRGGAVCMVNGSARSTRPWLLPPWIARPINVSAGRVPTALGAYTARSYGTDNLLIGTPLAYRYLTPIRRDAIPANQSLAAMARAGWSIPDRQSHVGDGPAAREPVRLRHGTPRAGGRCRGSRAGSREVTAGRSSPGIDQNGSPARPRVSPLQPTIGHVLGIGGVGPVPDPWSICCPSPQRRRRFPQRAWCGCRVSASPGWFALKSSRATGDCPWSISR